MIAGDRPAASWPRPNASEGDSKKSPRVYPGRLVLLQEVELFTGGLVLLDNLAVLGELTL